MICISCFFSELEKVLDALADLKLQMGDLSKNLLGIRNNTVEQNQVEEAFRDILPVSNLQELNQFETSLKDAEKQSLYVSSDLVLVEFRLGV